MMEGHKIKIQIADKYGFSQYMLSPAETLEMIHAESEAWVYADNMFVWHGHISNPPHEAQGILELNKEYLSTVHCVRFLPGLVGGVYSSPQGGEEE